MTIAAVGAVSSIAGTTATFTQTSATATKGADFAKVLDQASNLGVNADNLATQVATGELPNIQAFTSAAAKAELAVELAVAVRNRAVEAYQEIMRMSV